MSDVKDGLLIEEYKSCRELILKNIDIMEKNEVYATRACAALFVFSLQSADHIVSVATAWLPVIITVLGFLRFYGLDDVIDKINGHLVELETKHPPQNWTKYYRANNSSKVLKRTRQDFWLALFATTLAGAIYLTVRCPPLIIQTETLPEQSLSRPRHSPSVGCPSPYSIPVVSTALPGELCKNSRNFLALW
jgi:hypothetical protein